jgi:antitoxin (DNA-binding transcriptional repressor) of toxin-antitoxin stability system
MKIATVRDLRYNFRKIEAWIAQGDDVVVTKHDVPVMRISRAPALDSPTRTLPDYAARRRRIFGARVLGAREVEELRALETGAA